MLPEVGTIWRCIDENSEFFGQTCVVKESFLNPDFNGDGTLVLMYDDDTEFFTKVRRLIPNITHVFLGHSHTVNH